MQFWRLSEGDGLGLSCRTDGLFLGGPALLDRHDRGWAVRPLPEIERLLRRAYGDAVGAGRLMPGLAVVAAALNENNLCLAQIAALHLQLPDLPDALARRGMEGEDLLIGRERAADGLARTGWDPAKHPRAGTPPNPGWFAPTGGPDRELAQNEEEPKPEEAAEPLAALRRQLWQSGLATLREIDPHNPQLFVLSAPGWMPRQEDLDALDSAIRTAAIRRVVDKLMPNGVPIGRRGSRATIRELPGGLPEATDLFNYLRVGGTLYRSDANLTIFRLPGDSGFIALRPRSRSGGPAIDIKMPGVLSQRIHFTGR
ncbi:MAG TPA: hypothetical protein VE993_02690 [Stellaceae bacterium]|nr:hypothetical protein [Stellaceae bacterium]